MKLFCFPFLFRIENIPTRRDLNLQSLRGDKDVLTIEYYYKTLQ